MPSSFFILSSVSKDTAPEGAQDDLAKVTFGSCLAYLVDNGRNEKSARTLIGRWRRDHGDDAVQAAVEKARAANVSDPVSYIGACLRAAPRHGQVQRADGWEAQP